MTPVNGFGHWVVGVPLQFLVPLPGAVLLLGGALIVIAMLRRWWAGSGPPGWLG